MIRVLVPMLGRPHHVAPLMQSLLDSDPLIGFDVLFLLSPGDDEVREACKDYAEVSSVVTVSWPPNRGDWAMKINHGALLSNEKGDAEWLLLGASDISFHRGWATAALTCAEVGALVIGTKDLCNKASMKHRNFSTHPLVHHSYVERGVIDQPGVLLNEQYDHNFPDRELAETARMRGVWTYCDESIVEHLHPMRGIGESDATYQKGLRRFHVDQRIFLRRRRLWRHAPTSRYPRRVRPRP